MTTTEKMYMNVSTGTVGSYADWDYEDENGKNVNAVDLGEVTEVVSDGNGEWIEANA